MVEHGRVEKAYVYVMSTYGEHGAEDCTATLDRDTISTMLARYYDGRNGYEQVLTEAKDKLYAVLKETDAELSASKSGTNLTDSGWGGVQLFVIALEPNTGIWKFDKERNTMIEI